MSLISIAATLSFASVAHAATIFQINGGGNGHGIGMSQYGAYGYALHGKSYQFILSHYYLGTSLGSTDPNQPVRVLLGTGQAHFSGANQAGNHKLNPNQTYSVRALAGGMLGLFTASGKKVTKLASGTLDVTGAAPLALAGHGTYRGSLQFTVVAGALQTVNAVGLDDYVRGVVAAEMPASWPAAALEAQAIAARTYAITDSVAGNGYELYDDIRSQMYGGVRAETAATDAAVAATSGQIVTYHGAPATTYFFSSSGGHTENIENVWLGDTPEPWLKGVPDPYDGAQGQDPYHRWTARMTLAQAQKKLGALVPGRLRGIRVTKRGFSPRVVDAEVVGTGGTTRVTGPQLQSVFGLMSTYMHFTTISAVTIQRAQAPRATFERVRSPFWTTGTLAGSVYPAGRGATVSIQALTGKRWHTVRRLRVGSTGSYSARVAAPGSYRVLYGQVAGPTVAIG
jgi:SpoIID/LytB domain protein